MTPKIQSEFRKVLHSFFEKYRINSYYFRVAGTLNSSNVVPQDRLECFVGIHSEKLEKVSLKAWEDAQKKLAKQLGDILRKHNVIHPVKVTTYNRNWASDGIELRVENPCQIMF